MYRVNKIKEDQETDKLLHYILKNPEDKEDEKEIKLLNEELAELYINVVSISSNESQRPCSIETVIHVKKDEDQY